VCQIVSCFRCFNVVVSGSGSGGGLWGGGGGGCGCGGALEDGEGSTGLGGGVCCWMLGVKARTKRTLPPGNGFGGGSCNVLVLRVDGVGEVVKTGEADLSSRLVWRYDWLGDAAGLLLWPGGRSREFGSATRARSGGTRAGRDEVGEGGMREVISRGRCRGVRCGLYGGGWDEKVRRGGEGMAVSFCGGGVEWRGRGGRSLILNVRFFFLGGDGSVK